ncbi:uncharacterized protein LOC124807637 [Hydra vulgaris]|uniref:uncharacterized protein LOC124807637 n=1 Tax=Hydra vulgaris TaxID=6087 RepID=UPI0032EA84F1
MVGWISFGKQALCPLPEMYHLQVIDSSYQEFTKVREALHTQSNISKSRLAALLTIKSVKLFWDKAAIPYKQDKYSIENILRLHEKWRLLSKSKNRISNKKILLEQNFIQSLDALQNGIKTGGIGVKDNVLHSSVRRKKEGIEKKQVATENEKRRKIDDEETVQLVGYSSDSAEDSYVTKSSRSMKSAYQNSPISNPEFNTSKRQQGEKKDTGSDSITLVLPKNLISHPMITATADRTKLSNPQLMMNTSAILVLEILKLLKQISEQKFECLTVLVSGFPNCVEGKILSIKPIQFGTGLAICKGTLEDLEGWDLKANINAQVLDTTACNTGVRNGAATLLEDCKSMKTLLRLACRHHILELILGAFWSSLFKKEKKANYNIDFNNFQQEWICAEKVPLKKLNKFLDLENSFLKTKADETRVFLEKQVKCKHRRGDYKEAAEIALYLLGKPEPKVWKTCGANHHARWMSHLLYAPKIIFKEDLLDSDMEKLKIFLTFSSVLYVKAWLEATKGSDAPINDINLYNDLGALEQISGFSGSSKSSRSS